LTLTDHGVAARTARGRPWRSPHVAPAGATRAHPPNSCSKSSSTG
jgi:hypothetical protein